MANPRGQQRDKPFRDALRMEHKLAEAGEESPAKPGSLRYIARQLLIRASSDTAAAREVADRLDGKPAQSLDVTTTKIAARELADDDLADIAAGSSEGTAETPVDPTQLN
jgi:hypothetical protein